MPARVQSLFSEAIPENPSYAWDKLLEVLLELLAEVAEASDGPARPRLLPALALTEFDNQR